MQKLPISVLIIVYNVEKTIERCLNSISDLFDEIIVIHDGECKDNTIRIAEKYTNKIYTWKRSGNAEHHRAKAISITKNRWVFQIDADEFLSKELRDNFPNLIDNNFDIIEFNWPIWYKNKYFQYGFKRALYKKDKVYFISVNHEYVKPINNKIKIKKVNYLLEHKPVKSHFLNESFTKNLLPRARIHAKRLLVPFENLEKWNCSLTDWEFKNRIRLKYPILLGVIGSFIYLFSLSIFDSFKHKSLIHLKIGLVLGMWHASVYFYYFKYKYFPENYEKK